VTVPWIVPDDRSTTTSTPVVCWPADSSTFTVLADFIGRPVSSTDRR
jgi:hypothetical protein